MQKDTSTSHSRFSDLASLYSPILDESDGYNNYSSLYPSIFAPTPNDLINLPRYYSHTLNTDVYTHPSQYLFNEQQEDLLEQQNWSPSRLRETVNEAEALRQENINLKIANIELNKQVKTLVMLQSSSQNQNSRVPLAALPSPSLFDSLRKMHISEKQQARVGEEKEDRENLDVNRVSLPKSISVRSNGYLKTVQDGGSSKMGGGRVRAENRSKPVKAAQRVYVRGEEKEEKPLELQVFNQGMSKTELCNKWQQTGACPYGDKCHFAHGIEELRPILRHPRYKTEVCCMVLSGDPCPYGHRCHFRHSLTDQERLIAQQAKLRSLWQK